MDTSTSSRRTGLVEVIAEQKRREVRALVSLGLLRSTPFPPLPLKIGDLLLRYDSEDLVRPVIPPLRCDLRSLPTATSQVQGKLQHAIRTDSGYVCPRPVLEALEALEAVPLPARYSARAVSGGLALAILVRDPTTSAKRQVRNALDAAGVPLAHLELVDDRRYLGSPLPRRCDMREPGR